MYPIRRQSEIAFKNANQLNLIGNQLNSNFVSTDTMMNHSMYSSQNRKMYEVYNNKSIVNDSKEGQRFHQKQSELVDQDVYEINPCRNAD
jgi:hypothetical protein